MKANSQLKMDCISLFRGFTELSASFLVQFWFYESQREYFQRFSVLFWFFVSQREYFQSFLSCLRNLDCVIIMAVCLWRILFALLSFWQVITACRVFFPGVIFYYLQQFSTVFIKNLLKSRVNLEKKNRELKSIAFHSA